MTLYTNIRRWGSRNLGGQIAEKGGEGHMVVWSPFRPCGRDLVEFFNSTGWAFLVQVDYFRVARHSPTGKTGYSSQRPGSREAQG